MSFENLIKLKNKQSKDSINDSMALKSKRANGNGLQSNIEKQIKLLSVERCCLRSERDNHLH